MNISATSVSREQGGRTLDYSAARDDNLEPCSLYLSILDRRGVERDRFGDAETRLAGS